MVLPRHALPLAYLALIGATACLQAIGVRAILAHALFATPLLLPATALQFPAPTGFHRVSLGPRLALGEPDPSSFLGNQTPREGSFLFDRPYDAPRCAGVKIAAIAASPDPTWSFASLSGGAGEGPVGKLRRQGDDYARQRVWFVSGDRAWLVGDGGLCQALMFGGEPPVVASATPQAPLPPGDVRARIQRTGPREVAIDRGALDQIIEAQATHFRGVKVLPEQENGVTIGLRLSSIRPDSVLASIGLENGDRLDRINGRDVSSPDKALAAYATLKVADRLTLTVNRQGRTENLDVLVK